MGMRMICATIVTAMALFSSQAQEVSGPEKMRSEVAFESLVSSFREMATQLGNLYGTLVFCKMDHKATQIDGEFERLSKILIDKHLGWIPYMIADRAAYEEAARTTFNEDSELSYPDCPAVAGRVEAVISRFPAAEEGMSKTP